MWTCSFPWTYICLAGILGGLKREAIQTVHYCGNQRLLIESSKIGGLPKYLILENVKNLVSKKFMPLFQVWIDLILIRI